MSIDRNQQARDDFRRGQELHKLRQQFAQALAAGQIAVIDRIGQPIVEGALVIYRPPHDFVYEVKKVTPVLNPQAPPGLVEVQLACLIPVTFQAGQPIMSMIRIGTQQAPGHASLDTIEKQETPAVAQPPDETTLADNPGGHEAIHEPTTD